MIPRAPAVVALVLAVNAGPTVAQVAVTGELRTSASHRVSPVVYLVPDDGVVRPRANEPATIDQVGIRYLPTVRAVLPGTTVVFRNSDAVLHNVFSPAGPGVGFDLGTFSQSETRSRTFDAIGTHIILCHVHPEMYAYVVVLPTPFFGLVDDSGAFRIADVPPGRYAVHVWHRREQRFESELVVGTGEPVELTIDLTEGS